MFERISIDGFRSLLEFELSFQPGLNVLVGANGTGKSNFIAFLDFLSAMIEKNLDNAIGVAHGAGSVFSKEMFTDDEAELFVEIHGKWEHDKNSNERMYVSVREPGDHSGTYSHSCKIRYLRAVPAVFIAYERLETKSTTLLIIERKTERSNRGFDTKVVLLEGSEAARKEILSRGGAKTKVSIGQVELPIIKHISPERSIMSFIAGDTFGATFAYLDLIGYKSVNVDPVIARRPTPVGSTAQLEPTGEGLAGVLYQLKRDGPIGDPRFYMRAVHASERRPSFDSILSWCKEVNPGINEVNVSLDFAEALFRPSMAFSFGKTIEDFPFSRISDGTVKWLTLVTILLSSPDLNIIEEPENFLHPFMQESFITLCREVLHNEPNRTILISTHSPTLLDSCTPSELTIFELNQGTSRATRVSNRKELSERIEKARFGLGHYYRTGAVYGEVGGAR